MSELSIVFLIAGALIIPAVWAYNTWVLRSSEPRQPSTPDPLKDVGNDTSTTPGTEPVFENDFKHQDYQNLEISALKGHANEPVLFEDNELHSPEKRITLDPLIDAIALITPEAPVHAEAALNALPTTHRAGSKPFFIQGWNEQRQQWEQPAPDQVYSSFQAGIQLANRLGALNEIEFSEFAMKAQKFADTVNAALELPDMLTEVARARELDHFAAEHDVQLSLGLRCVRATWSPGYIQQHATRLGFVSGVVIGRMVMPATTPGIGTCLLLQFDAPSPPTEDPELCAVRSLQIHLDVAHVPRHEHPFGHIQQVCTALAHSMDGMIVDQNDQPIDPAGMQAIAHELESLYNTLDEHGLSAGSMQARRLFS